MHKTSIKQCIKAKNNNPKTQSKLCLRYKKHKQNQKASERNHSKLKQYPTPILQSQAPLKNFSAIFAGTNCSHDIVALGEITKDVYPE